VAKVQLERPATSLHPRLVQIALGIEVEPGGLQDRHVGVEFVEPGLVAFEDAQQRSAQTHGGAEQRDRRILRKLDDPNACENARQFAHRAAFLRATISLN